MGFWRCVLYFAVTGILAFLLGRVLPKKWFRPESAFFRCRKWERDGRIYEKLKIRAWQNRLPDMSRILPFMMPAKNIRGDHRQRLSVMIRETCVAEAVHIGLCITGLYALRLWPGGGGLALWLVYAAVLNLPFVLIQRFNRPRLMKLDQKIQCRRERERDLLCER